MRYDDMPAADRQAIMDRVMDEIRAMDKVERDIHFRGKRDLVDHIVGIFESIAQALGYMVALPLAIARKIAADIVGGFERGWRRAFDKY